jgi:hypothetical protein
MAVQTRFCSFDLHLAGVSASDRIRLAVPLDHKGNAVTATAFFTDPNRDFGAEGFSGASGEFIEITEGGGNIIRTAANTDVGRADPAKRGTGLAGWQEFLDSVEAGMAGSWLTQGIEIQFAEGLIQQVVVYDDA